MESKFNVSVRVFIVVLAQLELVLRPADLSIRCSSFAYGMQLTDLYACLYPLVVRTCQEMLYARNKICIFNLPRSLVLPYGRSERDPSSMPRSSSSQKNVTENQQTEKAPMVVAKSIRDAILDEIFKPGDHLPEVELAERFEVSRSPVREALLGLEQEGTVVISPYKGAIVKPLSAEEVLDIAELRLALISLVLKPAYRHLSPADFDQASDLAKRLTRTNNAKEHFGYHSQFWDGLFSKAQRPILHEVFRQLNDRMTRYEPLYLKVFPTPEGRPRQWEILIQSYRKGNIKEAFRAFRKIYLEVVDQLMDHLKREETGDSAR
jgi:DNA-binding GntR family transcriptional regulator